MSAQLWTLDELETRVRDALEGGEEPPSARVRAIPDRRTIRYYTTLGLVDRPVLFRGRTALYGRRHLLQLVAIKRLQQGGRSLVEVQEQLAGLADAALERLARVPRDRSLPAPALPAASAPDARGEEAPARDAFWRDVPADVNVDDAGEAPADEPETPLAPAVPAPGAVPRPAQPLVGLTLAPGVTLLFPPLRPLAPRDVEALHRAALPLVEALREQGQLERSPS